jgi:hypothetical protein
MGLPLSVRISSAHTFNQLEGIAVGVYGDGQHIGILRRDQPDRPVIFTHLRCYNALVNQIPDPAKVVVWVAVNLVPDEVEQVSAACRLVAKLFGGNEFPCAFSSPKGFFDGRMGFRQGSGRLGLTCASLVLGVFNAVGIDLVIYDSWKVGPDDRAWRHAMMQRVGIPHDIADLVRQEPDTVPRYRPPHVAGAAAREFYPVHFKKANRYARRLLKLLHEIRN